MLVSNEELVVVRIDGSVKKASSDCNTWNWLGLLSCNVQRRGDR